MNVLSEISKSKKIKHYCPYHEQAHRGRELMLELKVLVQV